MPEVGWRGEGAVEVGDDGGQGMAGGTKGKISAKEKRGCCTLIDARVWRELEERERFK